MQLNILAVWDKRTLLLHCYLCLTPRAKPFLTLRINNPMLELGKSFPPQLWKVLRTDASWGAVLGYPLSAVVFRGSSPSCQHSETWSNFGCPFNTVLLSYEDSWLESIRTMPLIRKVPGATLLKATLIWSFPGNSFMFQPYLPFTFRAWKTVRWIFSVPRSEGMGPFFSGGLSGS